MNRYRTFAAAAIVAVLSLGTSVVPASAAAPSHLQERAVKATLHQSTVRPKVVRKVVRAVAAAQRKLDNAAAYAPRQVSGDPLGTLLAHIATDRSGLSALTAKARAARTTRSVRRVRVILRQFNPTNYVLAANDLGNSRRMTTSITALAAKVQPGSAQADELAAAQSQIPTIIARALTVTARTPQAYLDAIQATSEGVLAAISAVSYYLGTTPSAP